MAIRRSEDPASCSSRSLTMSRRPHRSDCPARLSSKPFLVPFPQGTIVIGRTDWAADWLADWLTEGYVVLALSSCRDCDCLCPNWDWEETYCSVLAAEGYVVFALSMKFRELQIWNSENYKYEILGITNMKFRELQIWNFENYKFGLEI